MYISRFASDPEQFELLCNFEPVLKQSSGLGSVASADRCRIRLEFSLADVRSVFL